ncbi:MAG: response regulator transcription factor, partial [Chloroflexi bacterium]|nr:response regulator transcription factor [Chloroflexota bacterium]
MSFPAPRGAGIVAQPAARASATSPAPLSAKPDSPGIVRLAIVDDHPVVLSGLETALGTVQDIAIVAQGQTVADARAIAAREDVDVLLLDVRLPDGNGLDLLSELGGRGPSVLVLSTFKTRQYVAAAIRFGAQGFMLKTAPLEDLIAAIRQIADGGSAFSPEELREGRGGFVALSTRERQIIALVIAGRSNDEIAAELNTSRKTVEVHLSRMYERFDVMTRLELAIRADHEGWLDV